MSLLTLTADARMEIFLSSFSMSRTFYMKSLSNNLEILAMSLEMSNKLSFFLKRTKYKTTEFTSEMVTISLSSLAVMSSTCSLIDIGRKDGWFLLLCVM